MSGTNPGNWPDQPPKWAEDLEEMPERLYTAADLAKAREEGRRDAERKFWPIFLWLLGYTDFPERQPMEGAFYWRKKLRRDLEGTVMDFAAMLDEEEAGK